jgi:hypothetical protein
MSKRAAVASLLAIGAISVIPLSPSHAELIMAGSPAFTVDFSGSGGSSATATYSNFAFGTNPNFPYSNGVFFDLVVTDTGTTPLVQVSFSQPPEQLSPPDFGTGAAMGIATNPSPEGPPAPFGATQELGGTGFPFHTQFFTDIICTGSSCPGSTPGLNPGSSVDMLVGVNIMVGATTFDFAQGAGGPEVFDAAFIVNGQFVDVNGQLAPVPEPSTILLLGTGLLGLGAILRRSRRKEASKSSAFHA